MIKKLMRLYMRRLAVIAVTGLRLYDEGLSISNVIAALLLPLS